jgi:hypothetical protein
VFLMKGEHDQYMRENDDIMLETDDTVLGNKGIQERLSQCYHAIPKEIQPQEQKGIHRSLNRRIP